MFEGAIVIGAISIPFIVWYFFIGAFIGWVASLIVKGQGLGCLGNFLIGVVGSLFGGFLASLIGLRGDSWIASMLISIMGAAILLALFNGSRR